MADAAEIERLKGTPQYAEAMASYGDQKWRLRNLYKIVSERGAEIPFVPNEAQLSYSLRRWSRELIVKARQLGFSTFIAILILDYCLWRSNITAGIVDVTLDDARKKLAKIAFAYDRLPEWIRQKVPTVRRHSEAIEWANGSSVSVGTSYRGGTPQILHISEYGKISVDKPDHAKEIKTGSMQGVHQSGWCVVESTAHGTAGEFYDLVKQAEIALKEGRSMSALSWRLHFFGWWLKREYRIPNNLIVIPHDLRDYFKEIAPTLKSRNGITLDADQMAFYAQKRFDLGPDDCFEEFPSIMEETFFNSVQGAYWKRELSRARAEKRIGQPVPYDPTRRVNTWWDIGEDCTAIIFTQTDGVRVRAVDYHEEEGGSLQSAASVLDDKRRTRGFIYGKHIGPHDLENRDWANESKTRRQSALDLGIKFEVVPRVLNKADSIEAARRMLSMMYVCSEHCALLVERWDNYRKRWNKALQVFAADPVHDMASHGSDALQQGAMYKDDGKSTENDRPRRSGDRERRTSPWAS